MRKYLIGLIAALALSLGAAGGAPAQTPHCTDYLPVWDGCPLTPMATIYNDVGWYSSGSYARRTQTGAHFQWCLDSGITMTFRYVRQDGSVMWTWTKPSGWCGGELGANSGQTYVKVQVKLNGNGTPRTAQVTGVWGSFWW